MKKVFKGILSGAVLLLLVMNGCSDGVLSDPKVAYVGRVEHANLELDMASSVTTAVIGGITYLFTTGYRDDGISVFSVAGDGKLRNVDNIDNADDPAYKLNGAQSVTTAKIGGATYLFVAGFWDDGISVFSVAGDGNLTGVANVSDDTTLNLNGVSSVTTAEVGGTIYLFAAGQDDDGISVFSVAGDGKLTGVANVSDDMNLKLDGASSVTTAEVGGTTYLFAAGQDDNGISVFSVAANGNLTVAAIVDDADNENYNLDKVVSVTTAVIGGSTYLFSAGYNDNGISVFSVDDKGQLTSVTNVSDDSTLKLSWAYSVTTAVIGGSTYLFVAGAIDNGVSVFSVAGDGNLTNVANISDDSTLKLDGVKSITTAHIGTKTYLFSAGEDDGGISVFSVDDPSTPEHVYSVDDRNHQLRLDAVVSLAATTVSGMPYLLAAGETSDGFNVFQIDDSGMLWVKDGVTDNDTYKLKGIKAIATAEVEGTSYVIATGSTDNGISVFGIDADGKLTHKMSIDDNLARKLGGISDVVTLTAGGKVYIIAAGTTESGISSFSVAADGILANVGNIADSPTLYLGGVNTLAAATVGTSPYVFAASPTESGISTFSVTDNGALINVVAGNIADSDDAANYNLDGVSALATATVGTETYLFAGGTIDDGISVFKVADDGGLTHVVSIADNDDPAYTIDGVVALSTVTAGTETYLMAASDVENGVSIWTVAQDDMMNEMLNFVDSVVDNEVYKLSGSRDVFSMEIRDILYLYVAAYDDDAVNIFSLK